MPGGKQRRSPGGLASFPEEILLEILVRLPAKSVLRCRAVCRWWRRLTTDPDFLLAHHRHQPALPLISTIACTDDNRYEYYSLDAVHLQKAERHPVLWPRRCRFDVCCDGLVIVGSYICNPTTRQWAPKALRLVDFDNIIGLYRHQPSGEYRVLFWRQSNVPSAKYCPNDYCVNTVGCKKLRRIACSETLVDEELRGALSGDGLSIRDTPVQLHGNLHVHWKKTWSGHYHRILVFDTVAESFRQMRPPAVNPRHIMQLFDMNGMLAASCSKDVMMEMRIFTLRDYESEVWSFIYRVKLPEMEIRQFQEQGDWLAKVVSEEGDLLVSCFGWLLHYDRKGNLLAKLHYDDNIPVIIPCRLKESLIQHPFFQKKRNNPPSAFMPC